MVDPFLGNLASGSIDFLDSRQDGGFVWSIGAPLIPHFQLGLLQGRLEINHPIAMRKIQILDLGYLIVGQFESLAVEQAAETASPPFSPFTHHAGHHAARAAGHGASHPSAHHARRIIRGRSIAARRRSRLLGGLSQKRRRRTDGDERNYAENQCAFHGYSYLLSV